MARTCTLSVLLVGFPAIARSAGDGSLRGSKTHEVVNGTAATERHSGGFCVDTPGWTNGWKPCNRDSLGYNSKYCQAGSGWTCEGYVAKGWCRNDRCLSPNELGGVYACGSTLNSPEFNCCACGKSDAPPPSPPPTPSPQRDVTCAREGCGGVYKPQNKCQCTYNCEKYSNCCVDFWQVCSAPAPTPTPPAPHWPVKCQDEGCGGEYKPHNSCQCSYNCERYDNCCADFWRVCRGSAPTPTPPAPQPPVTYVGYSHRNAYHPYGAVDIDSDQTAPTGVSVQQCQQRCTEDGACSCVTYEPQSGKCWKRANCVASGWAYDNNYDVYMKEEDSSGYIEFINKNAFSPYGATDIDDANSAPTGLSADECMARCSPQWQCSCVTYERQSGKCWMRANCDPDGWSSPYNFGYNVYLKKSSSHGTQSANFTMEAPLLDNMSASNESALLLYP